MAAEAETPTPAATENGCAEINAPAVANTFAAKVVPATVAAVVLVTVVAMVPASTPTFPTAAACMTSGIAVYMRESEEKIRQRKQTATKEDLVIFFMKCIVDMICKNNFNIANCSFPKKGQTKIGFL